MIAASAEITVHLKDGTLIALPDACLSCGSVLSGGPGLLIRNDDLKRLWLGHRIGSERLRGAPYKLPDWSDPVLGTPPQASNALFQGWKKIPVGRRRGILEAKLGVQNGLAVATQQLPGLPRVGYDARIIGHILSREDGSGGHIMYAPLLRRTLDEPDSVWNTAYDGLTNQFLYLKHYLVGSQRITHLAVVDAPSEFVRTAYRLTRHSAEEYRFGILQYSACALVR